MLFQRLSPTRRRRRRLAEDLYGRVVARARDPWFYDTCDIPDTVDGRYDMIVIHAHLLFRRLGATGDEGEAIAQEVFNVMFVDMDRSLREMGVGDLSVGKHVKGMARAFYGRSANYERGLTEGREALRKALRENAYRLNSPAPDALERLAAYMEATTQAMASATMESLTAADGPWPPMPAMTAAATADAAARTPAAAESPATPDPQMIREEP